jgi:hypothetical protein
MQGKQKISLKNAMNKIFRRRADFKYKLHTTKIEFKEKKKKRLLLRKRKQTLQIQ